MYIYVCILCILIHLNIYIYIILYTYVYIYIYLQKYIFICEYMYIISSTRNPNLSDFQSVASFVPSRSLVPAMTACFYAGRSSYNPSTIPTVRILNESGPWVSPQILPKTEMGWEVMLEISEKNQSKWMILAMENSFGLIVFFIGFRFQFKSISFRSYQKWWNNDHFEPSRASTIRIGKKHEGWPNLSSSSHSWMLTYDLLNHNIPINFHDSCFILWHLDFGDMCGCFQTYGSTWPFLQELHIFTRWTTALYLLPMSWNWLFTVCTLLTCPSRFI